MASAFDFEAPGHFLAQVWFFDVVVLPCVKIFTAVFKGCKLMLQATLANYRHWTLQADVSAQGGNQHVTSLPVLVPDNLTPPNTGRINIALNSIPTPPPQSIAEWTISHENHMEWNAMSVLVVWCQTCSSMPISILRWCWVSYFKRWWQHWWWDMYVQILYRQVASVFIWQAWQKATTGYVCLSSWTCGVNSRSDRNLLTDSECEILSSKHCTGMDLCISLQSLLCPLGFGDTYIVYLCICIQ